MPVSQVIGGLPILSKVFDHGPYIAAFATFILLFGITYPLLCWSWGRLIPLRGLYLNFSVNDGIVYPIYMATAASLLGNSPEVSGIWKSLYWHWGVFTLGVALSLIICWWEVRIGKYSFRMQWLLWKLWHTLIFPVVFYWIVSTIPMLLAQGNFWANIVIIIGIFVFALTTLFDGWMPGAETVRRRLMALLKLGAR